MKNFVSYNPTRVIFGKGTISSLKDQVPAGSVVLMTYGGGSIRKNGVYDQVMAALAGFKVVEFGGIEANPRYETCMKAVEIVRRENVSFIVAAGGGSVCDGSKFIAAAAKYRGGDPWEILSRHAEVVDALPLGFVLTLPATGTESNPNSVISRDSTQEKLAFASDRTRPLFSILDPETTYTLDKRQTANGVIDSFVHVCEQYMTYPAANPTQDRQAEALLLALIDIAPRVMNNPRDYDARADLMYAANQSLNLHLSMGVPTDWATHDIGHELTALYGLDHAVTLAIVQPGVWEFGRKGKAEKLLQYGSRVWGIDSGTPEERITAAIARTVEFYRSMGVKTTLREYEISDAAPHLVCERLKKRGATGFGEHGDITPDKVEKILTTRL